jgi:hypothetical protein
MAEMPLAEHDNVVKTFPPDRTDRPFTISVLPRRSRRGWPIPNAHRPKAADEDVTVTRLARTFRSTRTRHRREQYMPLVAFCLRHFSADFIICTCEFEFRQAQGSVDGPDV